MLRHESPDVLNDVEFWGLGKPRKRAKLLLLEPSAGFNPSVDGSVALLENLGHDSAELFGYERKQRAPQRGYVACGVLITTCKGNIRQTVEAERRPDHERPTPILSSRKALRLFEQVVPVAPPTVRAFEIELFLI